MPSCHSRSFYYFYFSLAIYLRTNHTTGNGIAGFENGLLFLGPAGGPAGLSEAGQRVYPRIDSFDSNAQIVQDVPVYPFASKWIVRPLLSVPTWTDTTTKEYGIYTKGCEAAKR